MNIAIVENDGLTATFIKETLEDLGYNIFGPYDECKDCLVQAEKTSIDLIFMDIAINGSMDGIRCALKLQKEYAISSIFITSYQDKNTISDAMEAYPLGYLIKPVSELEIKSILERLFKEVNTKNILSVGDYFYNQEDKLLTYKEETIELTKDEQKAISLFFKLPGTTIPVNDIVNHVWNDSYSQENSLKELIGDLRDKLPELNIMYSSSIGYSIE